MVKFGSARISEFNSVNGFRGDQTGAECMIQAAYWHKNGWIGLRPKDPNIANGTAWTMKVACASNVVGYSQDDRYAIFFTDLREDVLTNADCSTLAPFCANKAGAHINVNGIWTGNMVERYLETGQYEKFTVTSLDDLCVGDTLVDGKLTSHTVVVVEGRPRINGAVFDEPEPILQWGSQGTEVRKLQGFFNEYGNAGLTVDGDYKSKTADAVRFFQGACGLETDGIYGYLTHSALVFYLGLRNVQVA